MPAWWSTRSCQQQSAANAERGLEAVSTGANEKVLVGVARLRFWGEGAAGWYCLAGAVTRYMEYIGDPVSYAEVMGVSGAAWRLVWNEGHWSPDNLVMAWYGPQVAEMRKEQMGRLEAALPLEREAIRAIEAALGTAEPEG